MYSPIQFFLHRDKSFFYLGNCIQKNYTIEDFNMLNQCTCISDILKKVRLSNGPIIQCLVLAVFYFNTRLLGRYPMRYKLLISCASLKRHPLKQTANLVTIGLPIVICRNHPNNNRADAKAALLSQYSQHLKSGLSSFIGFNSCPIVEWSRFRAIKKNRNHLSVFKWLA